MKLRNHFGYMSPESGGDADGGGSGGESQATADTATAEVTTATATTEDAATTTQVAADTSWEKSDKLAKSDGPSERIAALEAQIAEMKSARSGDAEKIEAHQAQLDQARRVARNDCLDKLEVLPEYRDLVPDSFDPLTDDGRSQLQAWIAKRPRIVADRASAVKRAGLTADSLKDSPGKEFVDLDQVRRGHDAIDAKFGGRGWLL